jgi:tol-pal system protein YbgF
VSFLLRVRGAGRSVGLLLALLVPSAGCAPFLPPGGDADVAALEQELNALKLAVHRSRSDTEAVLGQLERRGREQSAEIQKQLATVQTRSEALAADLSRLAARVEDLSQRVEALARQARAAAPAPPARPTTPAPAPRAPGAPQPADVYQTAYLDFSKGNYPLAIAGFREFLRRFADSDLADNAQYWIGEAYFSLGRGYAGQGQADKATAALEQAVQEFRKVIVNYPRGDKVPTALYKEALALLELKQAGLAEARLRYLLEHFPKSEEAPLARDRLAALKKE